ncbi:AraC family transcriptional regulator [Salinispora fenicalii]|uniref:AraC family transcriptional regulator n=1 Tax=Salinispora fenicalii TaxID=1137263 RepID=UPI0003812B25|nr:AraC family transcriptional regulator [Salinispora fenicalii]
MPVFGFDHVPGIVPVAVSHHRRGEPAPNLGAVGTHTHDFLVLFYAHRAHGTVRIDDYTWTVNDGDLFVIAPGQVVSAVDPFEEATTDGWTVWFPADVVRPGMPGAYSSWRTHPLLFPFAQGLNRAQRLPVPPVDQASLVERFAALDAELRARRDGHQEAALAHLTLLLVTVARLSTDLADHLRCADEPLLAAVFEAIEERYHQPISLADIAADLALTAGHLTTVVRRKTGRTVTQWITQRRMQQARLLLAETDLTVGTISRRVGYPDTSYFSKRFRARHGVTPTQWRDGAPPTG